MVVETLVALAGNALVQSMVTDGWEGVRHKVARLFGRGKPDPAIEKRLDTTRDQLTATPPDKLDAVQANLAQQWQTRFADLLADHPDAQAELEALVEEIRPSGPVTATDHSVAAGRDVNVTASGGSVAAGVIHGNVTLPGTPPIGPANG